MNTAKQGFNEEPTISKEWWFRVIEYIFVGIGGTFGSLARYNIGKKISENTKTSFPIGTFVINLTGTICLGIISNLNLNENLMLFAADGFLGGYTTFSTFMYEGFNLIEKNEKLNAVTYVIASLVFGIFGFILGSILSRCF